MFWFLRFFLLPISRRRSSDSLFLLFSFCLILSLSLSIQHMHAIYILGLVVINLSRRYILKLRIACNRRTDLYGCPTSTHNNVVISTFFFFLSGLYFSLPTTLVVSKRPFPFLLSSSSSPRANRYYFVVPLTISVLYPLSTPRFFSTSLLFLFIKYYSPSFILPLAFFNV